MEPIVKPASQEPLVIDTAALMSSLARNNHRYRIWATIATVIISVTLVVGVIGIYYQNVDSKDSRQQIDCIFKDLKVPTTGDQHKYIASIASQCNIKVIQ